MSCTAAALQELPALLLAGACAGTACIVYLVHASAVHVGYLLVPDRAARWLQCSSCCSCCCRVLLTSSEALTSGKPCLPAPGILPIQLQLICLAMGACTHLYSRLQLAELNALVTEGLKSGEVRPLPVTIFPRTEVEEAFRFMSGGRVCAPFCPDECISLCT